MPEACFFVDSESIKSIFDTSIAHCQKGKELSLNSKIQQQPFMYLKTLLVALTAAVVSPLFATPSPTPSIVFTYVPPPGSYNEATYKTTSVDITKYGVSAIINVFGTYWTKPYWATPVLPINADGTGSIVLITGGQDACAQEIYLFVVPLNATFTLGTGQAEIPADLEALAICSVSTQKAGGGNSIKAFGLDWTPKDTGSCIWGPGPNYFSGKNVSVDTQGRVHLKISYVNGVWVCAELISRQTLGYGTYTFTFDSDLSTLPGPVVGSAFVYSDDSDFAHREIDFIEFSNGDVVGPPNPYQFIVQPYSSPGHRQQFSLTNSGPIIYSTTWLPGIASFAAYAKTPTVIGHSATYNVESRTELPFTNSSFPTMLNFATITNLAAQGSVVVTNDFLGPTINFYQAVLSDYADITDIAPLEQSTMTADVSPTGNEKVHLNLWLFQGAAPSNSTSDTFEIVISSFTFQPLDVSKLQPRLTLLKTSIATGLGNDVEIKVSLP